MSDYCKDCGTTLSNDQRRYYEDTCERCLPKMLSDDAQPSKTDRTILQECADAAAKILTDCGPHEYFLNVAKTILDILETKQAAWNTRAQPPKGDVGCREAFERWAEWRGLSLTRYSSCSEYFEDRTRSHWNAWQAALNHRPPIDDAAVERGARAMCVAMNLDPDRQYPAAKEWEAMAPAARACLTAAYGSKEGGE